MKINRFSIVLAIMACSLVSAGCRGGSTHSFTPSPDGSVVASIRVAEVIIPAPDNAPVISHKSYLGIQRIPLSTEPSLAEILITNDRFEQYFLYRGGLTWSPNGRSVAFTTGNVGIDGNQPCSLWFVGISAKPQKALIAENVHSFRWKDDTHLVYVTKDGEVYRATISDNGAILELKTLFSVGNLDGAYDYAYHLSRYEFDNPLSPNAEYFVYRNGRNLTIANLSTATIEKSFPLNGMPFRFWWNDAGRNCVIEVGEGNGTHQNRPPYHYYLYQRERGTLTNLGDQLKSEWMSSSYGRVWCSDGKHLVLNSGYPYYKTWLFNTASRSAVWMESEITKIKEGTLSQLTMVPLPLEHLEYDSSQAPLPERPSGLDPNQLSVEEKRSKMIHANSESRVAIEPSPQGNLLAVCLPESEQKDSKSTSTYYVLKIETDAKGETVLVVQKKILFDKKIAFEGEQSLIVRFLLGITPKKKREAWMEAFRESFSWTDDGRGLLFVAGDKFRLESIR